MTLTQVWGVLLIFILCPLLGGLPVIAWIVYALRRRKLREIGTGNIGVQAAFYHGGTLAGILAVLSEAGKGIAAVMLARAFFPSGSEWEIIALIALVMGRYWMGKGAGTTNVFWGFVVHDVRVAGLVFLIGGIGFTILRERNAGRIAVLILLPAILAGLHPQDSARIFAAIALAVLMGWIYKKMPDDLDLAPVAGQRDSQAMFRFFRGDKAMISLNQQLDASKVGQKAATLSQLKRWGYPVPDGWVLPPGDDPTPLIESLQPSPASPLVVRSSAIGEDSEYASAAGQYETILNVTSRDGLQQAILRCQASYDRSSAVEYRQQRHLPEAAMAVLIQKQVFGAFSGVAFSRDPMLGYGDAVAIEALPGAASRIVSGKVTPEQYRVIVRNAALVAEEQRGRGAEEQSVVSVEGNGDVPLTLIRQVAVLARDLEARYHGIPQDIEWSYDGETLWLLQSRPITTLWPIWTRKIAAEVIPGLIRPLTWSINRPLTCGVWGEIFTLVLGKRSHGLDFNETATLHYSRAYFNASLLGQIFLRMGLPPESLEFLTLGAKFSKPPVRSTLQNLPGLLRLWRRELRLEKDFQRDYRRHFAPGLADMNPSATSLNSPQTILERINFILGLLKRATYYSILAPLSLALRQGIFKVKDEELDAGKTPELASLRSLQQLAAAARHLLPQPERINPLEAQKIAPNIFATLAEIADGQSILQQFDRFLDIYGYLSDVGTDIAVPTWKEDPSPVRELFAQFVLNLPPEYVPPGKTSKKAQSVQRRLDLKGRVTEVYSKLLAELRWSFVAIEQIWLDSVVLRERGDIFFLEYSEIEQIITQNDRDLLERLPQLIAERRSQLEEHRQLDTVPRVIYGNAASPTSNIDDRFPSHLWQGIGASPGLAEGRVKVLRNLQAVGEIDRTTILVVPYTDSGWAPLLARAGGIIAEVGGRLSHGAIVAREYGIPAVMDIHDATRLLRDGQRVRIDGSRGTVEII
ncbi:glycerol-3-phosphate acyltransferase [Argonema galeatum]|uniref:glycerol-3-phosphate acyltransferase n=1 Tax=Argonema galeatum TaxID=2942762 RepID=UPI002012C4EC|nr:glycerol-3-phosphate acyltransferase [Argonema galeatum]MCL1463292.1 glycerol-3-phosphate acyltransferase [Argonema galeatum A003/A1]